MEMEEWRKSMFCHRNVQVAEKTEKGRKWWRKGGERVLLYSVELLRCCSLLDQLAQVCWFVFVFYYSELQESLQDQIEVELNMGVTCGETVLG